MKRCCSIVSWIWHETKHRLQRVHPKSRATIEYRCKWSSRRERGCWAGAKTGAGTLEQHGGQIPEQGGEAVLTCAAADFPARNRAAVARSARRAAGPRSATCRRPAWPWAGQSWPSPPARPPPPPPHRCRRGPDWATCPWGPPARTLLVQSRGGEGKEGGGGRIGAREPREGAGSVRTNRGGGRRRGMI